MPSMKRTCHWCGYIWPSFVGCKCPRCGYSARAALSTTEEGHE